MALALQGFFSFFEKRGVFGRGRKGVRSLPLPDLYISEFDLTYYESYQTLVVDFSLVWHPRL